MKIRILIIICFAYAMSFIYYTKEIKHVNASIYNITYKINDLDSSTILGLTLQHKLVDVKVADYFTDYFLIGDTSNISTVQFNSTTYFSKNLVATFDATFINNLDSFGKKNCFKINTIPTTKHTVIPFFKSYKNWGGDINLLLKVITSPLSIAIYLLLLVVLYFKKKLILISHIELTQRDEVLSKQAWLKSILLFLFLFSILLLINPYYFLRDCNYAQFSPVINFSLDGFYASGSFPTYNPYQFAGVPTLPQSIYALYYPITHIAYLIAKYIIGNSNYFTTVFVCIHLFVGYIFCIKLLQKLNISIFLNVLAALSFVFSGAILKMTTNWYYAAPSVAFLPLISYYLWQYHQSTNKKFTLFLAVAFVLYFYSGNVQFCVYSFCFVSLFWMIVKSFTIKSIAQIMALFGIIFLCYLPQLIISFPIINKVDRIADSNLNTFRDAFSFVIPYISQINKIVHYNQFVLEDDQVNVNFNAIFSIVSFMVLISSFLFYKKIKIHKIQLAICILLLIATLFSLGKAGILWMLFAKLPVFSKFQHPFKFYIFINFFILIIAVVYLQKLILFTKYKKLLYCLVCFSSILAITITFIFNQKSTNEFFSKPYLINEKLPGLDLTKYRIAAVDNYDALNECRTFSLNFPTYFKMPSATGFEDLNVEKPDVFNYGNLFSVRYYICTNEENYKGGMTNNYVKKNKQISEKISSTYKQIYKENNFQIFEDSSALPILQCFNYTNAVNINYVINYHNKGADFLFDKKINANKIILSFTWRSHLYVYINNKKCIPQKDTFGRLIVFPVEPFEKIELIYNPFN
jgi:hypothetical protein